MLLLLLPIVTIVLLISVLIAFFRLKFFRGYFYMKYCLLLIAFTVFSSKAMSAEEKFFLKAYMDQLGLEQEAQQHNNGVAAHEREVLEAKYRKISDPSKTNHRLAKQGNPRVPHAKAVIALTTLDAYQDENKHAIVVAKIEENNAPASKTFKRGPKKKK